MSCDQDDKIDIFQWRRRRREEIAISLLQGKLILAPKDGYDPGGCQKQEIVRTVSGALSMAEELMSQNECFDGHDWEYRRVGGDPCEPDSAEQVKVCKRCGEED